MWHAPSLTSPPLQERFCIQVTRCRVIRHPAVADQTQAKVSMSASNANLTAVNVGRVRTLKQASRG